MGHEEELASCLANPLRNVPELRQPIEKYSIKIELELNEHKQGMTILDGCVRNMTSEVDRINAVLKREEFEIAEVQVPAELSALCN